MIQGGGLALGLRSGHPDVILLLLLELSYEMRRLEIRLKKTTISEPLLIKNAPLCKNLSQHDRFDDTLHKHGRHHRDRQHAVKPVVL